MYQTKSSTLLLKTGFRSQLSGLRKFFLTPVFCILLAGCGFKPVYGQQDNNITSQLASVQVADIPNRDGQVLKYKLIDLLQPQGNASTVDYELKVKLNTREAKLGIQEDLRVTRYDIIKTAKYQLIALDTNREVDAGSITIKSSYNRTVSEFSTYVAAEDSDEKAALELAQEIRSRLIYHFSK